MQPGKNIELASVDRKARKVPGTFTKDFTPKSVSQIALDVGTEGSSEVPGTLYLTGLK